MKLVSTQDTYNLDYEDAVFKLKKLTVGDLENIKVSEDSLTKFGLELIERSLVDWENIVDGDNNKVPCTKENIKNLPYQLFDFLIQHVNKVNGLIETAEAKETEKK